MMIYEEIFRGFNKGRVKYMIVGGMAVNLLGYFRSTFDLDIVIEMTEGNIRKAVNILSKEGYLIKQPVEPMDLAFEEKRRSLIREKGLKVLSFYKEKGFGEVDILIDTPVSYEAAGKKVRKIKSGTVILPVMSIDDLVKLKKKAARKIDNIDVEILKTLKKLTGRTKK